MFKVVVKDPAINDLYLQYSIVNLSGETVVTLYGPMAVVCCEHIIKAFEQNQVSGNGNDLHERLVKQELADLHLAPAQEAAMQALKEHPNASQPNLDFFKISSIQDFYGWKANSQHAVSVFYGLDQLGLVEFDGLEIRFTMLGKKYLKLI